MVIIPATTSLSSNDIYIGTTRTCHVSACRWVNMPLDGGVGPKPKKTKKPSRNRRMRWCEAIEKVLGWRGEPGRRRTVSDSRMLQHRHRRTCWTVLCPLSSVAERLSHWMTTRGYTCTVKCCIDARARVCERARHRERTVCLCHLCPVDQQPEHHGNMNLFRLFSPALFWTLLQECIH